MSAIQTRQPTAANAERIVACDYTPAGSDNEEPDARITELCAAYLKYNEVDEVLQLAKRIEHMQSLAERAGGSELGIGICADEIAQHMIQELYRRIHKLMQTMCGKKIAVREERNSVGLFQTIYATPVKE